MPRGIRNVADLTPEEAVDELANSLPVTHSVPVRVILSKPLGGSSKVPGTLDVGRSVITVKIGKEEVEMSITSQMILYWVRNPVTK